ncbi:hypothetical protein ACF0H5_011716 [Mactra antiquata]
MEIQHPPEPDEGDLPINTQQRRIFPQVIKTGKQMDEPFRRYDVLRSKTNVQNDNRFALLNMPDEMSNSMQPQPEPILSNSGTISGIKQSYKLVHAKPYLASHPYDDSSNKFDVDAEPLEACQNRNSYLYDDFDQEENLDNLVDLPEFDEIPYALIMSNMVDMETLKLSQRKQRQRIELERLQLEAEIKDIKLNTKTLSASINGEKQSSFTSYTDSLVKTNEVALSEESTNNQFEIPNAVDDNNTSDSLKHSSTIPTKYESNDFVVETHSHENKPDIMNTYDSMDQTKTTADRNQPDDKQYSQTNPKSPYESAYELLKTIGTMDARSKCRKSEGSTKQDNFPSSNDSLQNTRPEECQHLLPVDVPKQIVNTELTKEAKESDLVSEHDAEENQRGEICSPNKPDTDRTPVIDNSRDTGSTSIYEAAQIVSTTFKDMDQYVTPLKQRLNQVEQLPVSPPGLQPETDYSVGSELQSGTDEHETDPRIQQHITNKQIDVTHHQTLSSVRKNTSLKENADISGEQKQNHEPKGSDQEFIRRKRMERFLEKASNNTSPQEKMKTSGPARNVFDRESPSVTVKPKVFRKTMPLYSNSNTSSNIAKEEQPVAETNTRVNVKLNKELKTTKTDCTESTTEARGFLKLRFSRNKIPEENSNNRDSKKRSSENTTPLTMKLLNMHTNETKCTSNDNVKPKTKQSEQELSLTEATKIEESNQQVKCPEYQNKEHDRKPNNMESEFEIPSTMRLLAGIKSVSERKIRSRSEKDNVMKEMLETLLSVLEQTNESCKPKDKIRKKVNKNALENAWMSESRDNSRDLKTVKKRDDGELTSHSTKSKDRPSAALEMISNSAAKLRHDAFRALKLKQTGQELRCTTCGRPDCDGQNITQMKTMVRMANEIGLEVHDVSPDGNCMFAAVVDQLKMYGDNRFDCKSLRESAVYYLIEHPESEDGTHYSHFVSCEWNAYLQKMMSEGEWGDHIILKSLVEVVQHTIKIFQVNGTKSNWIELQPTSIDVSNDGIHLVLGLVGEVHYTSLRPADSTVKYVPPPTSLSSSAISDIANMGEIQLEGNESIDMFQDDYVDPTSQFPVSHFSFLLKTVIPIKYVEAAARFSSDVMDKLMINNRRETSQFYGPAGDGVFHRQLFANNNSDGETNAMVETKMFDESNNVYESYTFVTEDKLPGFGKIRIDLFRTDTAFLSGLGLPFPNGSNYSNTYDYCWELVVSMKFDYWPNAATSWSSRTRLEGWPSKEVIQLVMASGFTVVPFCHPLSFDPEDECQILFIAAEHLLFREAVTKHQKHCFIMMIAMCTQTMHDSVTISYRHFKNIFFYACERIPLEHWETRPASCLIYMIDSMVRCIRSRNLPNYFIDTYNMIDHLDTAELCTLEEQLNLLRSQPVMFLKDVNGNLEQRPLITDIIDRVDQNVPSFCNGGNLKMTTLDVFVPATIDLAKGYIQIQNYEDGYELLSSAFQERLSVSSCSDMVTYQTFLFGAVSGLDLSSLIWFSAYTDKQLEGQLSKSLIRETCSDVGLTTIQNILPLEICGSFCNTEVPAMYAQTPCSFSSDFVRFLFIIQKISDILPILKYCHDVYKSRQQEPGYNQFPSNDNSPILEDFNEYNMFGIYTAMYKVYSQQGQLAAFNSVLPDVIYVCERIGSRGAFSCLKTICKQLGDTRNMDIAASKYNQLPEDENEMPFLSAFGAWPYHARY